MLFPPVIHNFRNKAGGDNGYEYHIKSKLCIMGGTMLLWPKTASHKKGVPQG